jgi:hypothetical protein
LSATQSIWELTIVTGRALLGSPVASVSLAISGSEISWAGEVVWLSGRETTALEDGLTDTSVAEGTTQAPSASDTLVLADTGVAVTETVALVSCITVVKSNDFLSWFWNSLDFGSLVSEMAGSISSP